MAKFTDIFLDVTKDAHKIPKEDYLPTGIYPIIDQGQEYIAGYANDPVGLYIDVPAIIFGDHTRIIKYVDMPCYLGADGVKLLKAKEPNANYKYLYYALSHAEIPNTGYNRHFKWLKEIEIGLPIQMEQQRIVTILDKLCTLISLRKQQLAKLDEAVKSHFIELFGDPIEDASKWEISTIGEEFEVTSGGTPATGEKAFWNNGTIPWIGSNMCQDVILYENDGKFITEEGYAHSSAKWFYKGTVLVALVGATIGKTALLRFDTTTNQNIAAIDVNKNEAFLSEFVFYHMQLLYKKFIEIGNGKFKMANQGFIRQLHLICPPVELQQQFAAFVKQTDKTKMTIQQSLNKLETLKKSLMQQYFG